MTNIPIFADEFDIRHLVRNNETSAVAHILTTTPNPVYLKERVAENRSNDTFNQYFLDAMPDSMADIGRTDDVMPLSSILVSSLWNRNDDIFLGSDLIKASKTGQFKPINWQHHGSETRGNEIIGVMIDTQLFSGDIDNLQEFSDADIDEFQDDLNGLIHIKQDGLIWSSYFPSYAAKIEKGIQNNNLFVSMECFFGNFGYGIRTSEDELIKLIDRNEDNASLSKHLKCFGGKGTIVIDNNEFLIGRWLRDINFSGQGIVDKPANKQGDKVLSIIIGAKHLNKKRKKSKKTNVYSGDFIPVAYTTNDNVQTFTMDFDATNIPNSNIKTKFVYKSVDKLSINGDSSNMNPEDLTAEINKLQNEITKVRNERDEAIKRATMSENQEAQVEIDGLKSDLQTSIEDGENLTKEMEALRLEINKVDDFKEEIVALTKQKEKIESELSDIRAIEIARERKDILSKAGNIDLGYSLEQLAEMSDETFEAVKTTVEKLSKAGVSGEVKLTDQNVSSESKSTDQGVSGETKLTEASETDATDDADDALKDAESDEADLLLAGVSDEVNERLVARTLVRNLAMQKEN